MAGPRGLGSALLRWFHFFLEGSPWLEAGLRLEGFASHHRAGPTPSQVCALAVAVSSIVLASLPSRYAQGQSLW